MSVFEGTADDMWPEDEFEIDPEFAAEEDYPEEADPNIDTGLAAGRPPGLDGWS